jgi:hypothetical protein
MGLPSLEIAAADPPDPTPLITGTVDVDPPVMVPELVPMPEPALGLEPSPLHPVLVVTVCPLGAGSAGTTPEAPNPTRGVAAPPPTRFGGSTRVATPPTKGAKALTPSGGSKSPEMTGGGSAFGWNGGAASVASEGSNVKDPVTGLMTGCGWKNDSPQQRTRRHRA